MECWECVNRLWEYLDGELEAEEVMAMRNHLAGCGGCRPAYECDRAFLVLLSRCAAVAPGCSAALRKAVHLKLAELR